MPCLFTYSLVTDSGAAPNPFGGVCTLALCKPRIRRGSVGEGDWVAGVAGHTFGEKHGNLAYAMKVAQKVGFDEYDALCREKWDIKIPDKESDNLQKRLGDCQYCFRAPGGNLRVRCDGCQFGCKTTRYAHGRQGSVKVSGYARQRPGPHRIEFAGGDLGGQFVLIAEDYYYFGEDAVPFSRGLLNANIGRNASGDKRLRAHRKHGDADCQKFVAWLTSGKFDAWRGKPDLKGHPRHFG